jgi:hypothetical protein
MDRVLLNATTMKRTKNDNQAKRRLLLTAEKVRKLQSLDEAGLAQVQGGNGTSCPNDSIDTTHNC